MGKKFCRIFENGVGDQLLLQVKPSEDSDDADILFSFRLSEAVISTLTMGEVPWEQAEDILETYSEEDAYKILDDPEKFMRTMIGI